MSRSRLWLFYTCVSLATHCTLLGLLGVQAFLQKQPPKPQRVVRVRLATSARSNTTKAKLLPRKQPVVASSPSKTPDPKSTKRSSQPLQSASRPAAKKTVKHRKEKADSYQKALNRLDSLVGVQSQSIKTHKKQFADQLNQELKQDYAQRVQSLIQNAYRLPNVLSSFEKTHLRVILRLHIGKKGNLLTVKVETPSGNNVFDQAVTKGTRHVASFGPPPAHQVDYYRTQGILVEFCPTACPL